MNRPLLILTFLLIFAFEASAQAVTRPRYKKITGNTAENLCGLVLKTREFQERLELNSDDNWEDYLIFKMSKEEGSQKETYIMENTIDCIVKTDAAGEKTYEVILKTLRGEMKNHRL